MGYDLTNNRGEDFRFSIYGWSQIQRLAIKYGWEPLGTEPPEHYKEEDKKEWSGNYNTNDWQYVTKEDSKNMAKALTFAYYDLPKMEIEPDPVIFFSGDSRNTIKEFIEFIKNAGFCIS